MPTELKQRKKSQSASVKDETSKATTEAAEDGNKTSSSWDVRGIMCVLSLAACGALSW